MKQFHWGPGTMAPLPNRLRNSIRINWYLTSWCNYRCEYCPVDIFLQRSKAGEKQAHAFDHHSVAEWLEALRLFEFDHIYLNISGGEPFLDRKNLHDLLAGVLTRPNVHPLINTNGHWDPEYYRDLDTSRIGLVVSYHPGQVKLERYLENLRRIRAAGFLVGPLNYVLAPENLDHAERAVQVLEAEGFLVSVSPMISAGLYGSRETRSERELDLIERYNPKCDTYFLVTKPPTKGRPCFYPAMSYDLRSDGRIQLACMDSTARDLFSEGLPPLPHEAVPCEFEHCIGCGDMYRSLVDAPFSEGPLGFFERDDWKEVSDEIRAHRARYQAAADRRPLPFGLDRLLGRRSEIGFAHRLSKRAAVPKATLVNIRAAAVALPEQAVFGHFDQSEIVARAGDRISVSGWAATRDPKAPVRMVRMILDGQEIGVFRDFGERPYVATTYGRADLLRCGWRGMLYLPPRVPRGDHTLVPEAYDSDGNSGVLPASIVTIVD